MQPLNVKKCLKKINDIENSQGIFLNKISHKMILSLKEKEGRRKKC